MRNGGSHSRHSYPNNKSVPKETIQKCKTSTQKQEIKKLHKKKVRQSEIEIDDGRYNKTSHSNEN